MLAIFRKKIDISNRDIFRDIFVTVFRFMSDQASTPAVDRDRSRHLVPTVICTISRACDTTIPDMSSLTMGIMLTSGGGTPPCAPPEIR